jgi:tRNA threonylcarbamoyladenosine biosynthesis protein TsaE
MTRLWLPDVAATETLGRALAMSRPARAVVHLHGDLGAGKSTLARALLRALGVRGAIRSPTYTLVERYALNESGADDGSEALHLDLYRVAEAGELEFLGLDPAEGALWLVEWPERGGAGLPAADLRLELAIDGDGRSIAAFPSGPAGEAWLARLEANPELQRFSRPA